jgi:hypothetical protein
VSRTRGLWRRSTEADRDTRRSQRVSAVLELVERFVYDLGLLVAGEVADMSEYVDARCAQRLRSVVQPALAAGAMIRTDFGEYAQVHIEGDLLDLSVPVAAVVEFDDRSTRLDEDGSAVNRSRRRVRLQLLLDPGVSQVLDHRVELIA